MRERVEINWHLWDSEEALMYIEEMMKIGLPCRINFISENEWILLSNRFGAFVERGRV